jgi:hypothetical protein
MRDPQNHLPKLWQLVCEKLGARYEAIAFGSATDAKGETSDLVQIQSTPPLAHWAATEDHPSRTTLML